jgi:hypothetical protein
MELSGIVRAVCIDIFGLLGVFGLLIECGVFETGEGFGLVLVGVGEWGVFWATGVLRIDDVVNDVWLDVGSHIIVPRHSWIVFWIFLHIFNFA